MRYVSAGAFRTALERRLLTQAQQTGVPLMRLRKLVAFDRLIARLVTATPDRWILKGAVALHFRAGPRFRGTMDLDLGRHDDEQAATADLLLAQTVDLGDYFRFAIQRTSRLDALLEGAAVRYRVTAEVDGRPFEFATVDVGFGNPPPFEPDVLRGPDLLSFADIPPAQVPTLALEPHVAEKIHAYTRGYVGGRASTRVKVLRATIIFVKLAPLFSGEDWAAPRASFDVSRFRFFDGPIPSVIANLHRAFAMAFRCSPGPFLKRFPLTARAADGSRPARLFDAKLRAGILARMTAGITVESDSIA